MLCFKYLNKNSVFKINIVYNNDLENDLKNEESGSLGRLFRSLSTGERSDSIDADIDLAKKEAQKLYNVNFFLLY